MSEHLHCVKSHFQMRAVSQILTEVQFDKREFNQTEISNLRNMVIFNKYSFLKGDLCFDSLTAAEELSFITNFRPYQRAKHFPSFRLMLFC